jgi:hypothetical protein
VLQEAAEALFPIGAFSNQKHVESCTRNCLRVLKLQIYMGEAGKIVSQCRWRKILETKRYETRKDYGV